MSSDNPVDKGGIAEIGPLYQGIEEPGFERTDPILDVERFKMEYLFGVPLTAPLTGQTLTDDTIKHFIKKGIGDFETSVRIPVNPVRLVDRHDFKRADDIEFGTRRLTRWPVIKIERLQALWPGRRDDLAVNPDPLVEDPNSQVIDYPTSWATVLGDTGLLRIVPNTGTLVNADVSFIASSAYRSVVLGGLKEWPNMWRVVYTAGFEPDKVPAIVNDLIGIMGAIRLLSQLGPAIFPINAQSISIDGMSQGTTTAGPMWLQARIAELVAERDRLVAQLKGHYCTDLQLSSWG